MKKILIIDCDGVSWQVFHGMPPLSHGDEGTSIIYGFLNHVFELQEFEKADHIVFAWDSRKSKRKKLFPEYKAKRAAAKKEYTEEEQEAHRSRSRQFTLLRKKILPDLGFSNVFMKKGYEGDDIIASVALDQRAKNFVRIIGNDGDLFQLINDNCTIFNLVQRKVMDSEYFFEKYGVYPDMWADIKGIAGCFDGKTEVLTYAGWKLFEDVTLNDLVYSMDPETRDASYETVDNVVSYEYKGDMYKIKGDLVDLVVTPDHRFFGSTTQSYNPTKNKIKFKKFEDILNYKNFTIPISSSDADADADADALFFTLPEYTSIRNCTYKSTGTNYSNSITYPAKQIEMGVWVQFFGIWLADGHVSDGIGVSAKKQRKVAYFKPILDATPWEFRKNHEGWEVSDIQLASYLSLFGKSRGKYIPQEIKNLPSKYLLLLFNSMMQGDGYIQGEVYYEGRGLLSGKACTSKGKVEYYTSSKQLADDFQEISIKLGFSTAIYTGKPRTYSIRGKSGISHAGYCVRILKSNNCNIRQKSITKVPYNDTVWCVETKKHKTILVRRNGHVVWSGNCPGDEVPGIHNVGYDRAINYLLGNMKPSSVLYQRIKDNPKIIKLTRKLVVLPFKGAPKYTLQQDKCTVAGFKKVAREYGLKSYLAADRIKSFKGLFCNDRNNTAETQKAKGKADSSKEVT